jgi:hypothetical protein
MKRLLLPLLLAPVIAFAVEPAQYNLAKSAIFEIKETVDGEYVWTCGAYYQHAVIEHGIVKSLSVRNRDPLSATASSPGFGIALSPSPTCNPQKLVKYMIGDGKPSIQYKDLPWRR